MPTPHLPRSRSALLGLALAAALLGLDTGRARGAGEPPVQGAQSTSPQPAASQQPGAAAPAVTGSAPGGIDLVKDRDAIFDAFYKTGLETATAYTVTNLTVKKDTMTLLLKQGTLFLMKPIAGEVTGAAFVGDGEASMTPPNRSVRYMLNKYSGAETLKEPFTEAVFRFSDGTDRLLLAQAKADPAGAAQAGRAAEIFQSRNSWMDGTRELHFESEFMESRLSNTPGMDFFVCDFHSIKHDWLTFLFRPQESHENSLVASATMGAKDRRYLIPWMSWHRHSDYNQAGQYVLNPDHDGPRALKIEHTDLVLDMPTTKTVNWEARQRIQPLHDALRVLRLDLVNNANYESRWWDESFYPVKLTSVTDDAGHPFTFQHRKDQLLVFLPVPARAGTPLTIVTRGTADVIYQLTAESFSLIQSPWYPQYGFIGGRATFHWTVRVPRPFLLTGSGRTEREFEDKEKNQNGIEMQCDIPVSIPWVMFGRFQKDRNDYLSEESKRSVVLTVHSFPTMTTSITDHATLDLFGLTAPVTFNLKAPMDKVKGLLNEFQQVLKLYEKIYGPYPYDELHIGQMAPQAGFSQGPPGFIRLTGLAFLSQAEFASYFAHATVPGDFTHGLYAHETAHQWWGNQVGWASDEDEWLSEGFAEHASSIFVQAYQGQARLQQTLQRWKQNAKIADKEGPIVAANMLNGPNAWRSRTFLLYDKAPYVLHMLRVQLDDQKYAEVMRSTQETYKGRNISTEMLLAEINRVTKQDYTFFFDQWIWGTGIPTFRYTWRAEKQAEGKFLIAVHVSQDDKSNVKKVMMPVHIHFKDKTIPSYQPVVQAEQDIKIMSPAEPKDVTLDDDHTLLADIVKAN